MKGVHFMRLHRLIGIIMLLDARGIMKAANLANILETSERTIYRDIDILCEAGLPIQSIPGPTGGYSFMENYKINSNMLTGGDIIPLLLSTMGVRPEKNTEMAQQVRNAVIRLESSLSEEHREEIIRAREKFFIDTDPWWGKRILSQYVDVIQKSVLDLKKLRICYKKHGGDISERCIHPYGVVVKESEWYVVAFCELKNDIRVFKCSRIENMEVLEQSFSMPQHFSLEKFWEESKQQFVRQVSMKKVPNSYPVKIRLLKEGNNVPQGFAIINSFPMEDSFIYDIDMLSFSTACSVIFPSSDKIEVLEPVELREYIVDKAKKIISFYK
jgi:predicted DNA-binding transcriptional regulator YafY